MNFRQIEVFRAVMLTGTTTEAAALLHTSQPAVSRLIAQLQSSARIKLFELRKGRLAPTPEAKALLCVVERSYVGLDKITEAVTALRNAGVGRLNIGSLPSLGVSVLPLAIKRFMHRYPRASFSVQTIGSTLVKEGVATGRFDIGIAMDQIDTEGVVAVPLIGARTVCVMGPEHKLATRSRIRMKDLNNEPLLTLNPGDITRLRFNRLLAKRDTEPNILVETTYSATLCAMALQGIGIGLVNPLIASSFIERGLVIKPFEPAIDFDLLLLFPPHSPASQMTEHFAGVLKECLRDVPGTYPSRRRLRY